MRIAVVHALAPERPAARPAPGAGTAAAAPRVLSVALDLAPGATVGDAVRACGLMAHLPGQTLETLELGVFNHPCTPDRVLAPGDRVEIYRPLQIEPKAARHLRVAARRKAETRARHAAAGAVDKPMDR